MKSRPQISDDEIRGLMNFDQVLASHAAAKKSSAIVKSVGLIAGGGLIATIIWLTLSQPQVTPPDQTAVIDSVASATNRSATKEAVREEANVTPQELPSDEKTQKQTSKPTVANPVASTESSTSSSEYIEAEPTAGYPDLYEYFRRELKYPAIANDSIEGVVTVTFVISTEGSASQISIDHSIGPEFDEEARRVIAGMPGWKPARLNGKAVPAKISIPLTFERRKK